jgi:hypothetical protein
MNRRKFMVTLGALCAGAAFPAAGRASAFVPQIRRHVFYSMFHLAPVVHYSVVGKDGRDWEYARLSLDAVNSRTLAATDRDAYDAFRRAGVI